MKQKIKSITVSERITLEFVFIFVYALKSKIHMISVSTKRAQKLQSEHSFISQSAVRGVRKVVFEDKQSDYRRPA